MGCGYTADKLDRKSQDQKEVGGSGLVRSTRSLNEKALQVDASGMDFASSTAVFVAAGHLPWEPASRRLTRISKPSGQHWAPRPKAQQRRTKQTIPFLSASSTQPPLCLALAFQAAASVRQLQSNVRRWMALARWRAEEAGTLMARSSQELNGTEEGGLGEIIEASGDSYIM